MWFFNTLVLCVFFFRFIFAFTLSYNGIDFVFLVFRSPNKRLMSAVFDLPTIKVQRNRYIHAERNKKNKRKKVSIRLRKIFLCEFFLFGLFKTQIIFTKDHLYCFWSCFFFIIEFLYLKGERISSSLLLLFIENMRHNMRKQI